MSTRIAFRQWHDALSREKSDFAKNPFLLPTQHRYTDVGHTGYHRFVNERHSQLSEMPKKKWANIPLIVTGIDFGGLPHVFDTDISRSKVFKFLYVCASTQAVQ